MRKILTLSISLIIALALFASCSAAGSFKKTNNNNNTNNDKEFTIKHSKGETKVPANPSKVVVFDMGILDTIDALNIDVELAVPVASIPSYLSKYENATNAGAIKEPDLEAIYEFEPDIIFISTRQADFYDELSEIAPTVYVDLNPETYMDDIYNSVENIGKIFDKTDDAEAKITEIKNKIDEVVKKTSSSDDKALILLTNDGNISAFGKGSRFGIIHDVLKVKTADSSIEASTHGQNVSFEYISEVNPDIIFVIDRTTVVGGTNFASSTLDNDLVKSTNAYKTGKIVNLNAEVWYLAGGGINSVKVMIDEVAELWN